MSETCTCPNCHRVFRVPDCEHGDHPCPKCGFAGGRCPVCGGLTDTRGDPCWDCKEDAADDDDVIEDDSWGIR